MLKLDPWTRTRDSTNVFTTRNKSVMGSGCIFITSISLAPQYAYMYSILRLRGIAKIRVVPVPRPRPRPAEKNENFITGKS